MCPLLALNIEPAWLGWLGIFGGPLALILVGAAYFKLDNRYVRKDDARDDAALLAKEHAEIVSRLEATDQENAEAIKEVANTFRAAHEAIRLSLHAVRNDMNTGFLAITKTVNDGVLSLTKEVAEMRGRLSGAGGVHLKSDDR